jgi:hypothetical protein
MRYLLALLAVLLSFPVFAERRPLGICIASTYTVEWTDPMFQPASSTASKTLATLTSLRQKLCWATLDPQIAFSFPSGTGGVPTGTGGRAGTGGTAALGGQGGRASAGPGGAGGRGGAGGTGAAGGTGSGVTMSCSLGSATPGNTEIYVPHLSMLQDARSISAAGIVNGRDLDTPDYDLSLVLTCQATGATFGTGTATRLLAGKLWVTIYKATLPPGP